ncbi:MAG: helix-turn-helix transcriptional regulator [Pleurocapsa sp.]
MKVSFSIDNQQEFYDELQQQIGAEHYVDRFERSINIHPKIGEGRISHFQFSSGLELQIQELSTNKSVVLEAQINYANLGIFWIVSGSSHYNLEDHDFFLEPQQHVISYASNMRGCLQLTSEQKVVFVGLSLETYFRRSNLITHKKLLPERLKKLLKNHSHEIFWQSDRTTSEMNVVLQQIINCPYQGITKQIYLESKSLELLALELGDLERNGNKNTSQYQPQKDEIERLYHAREIIKKNLDSPPSLDSLAKQIGLNDYKLKQGFKAVFGNTVFGYLHDYRMERSHLLLRSGTMNVTQVAQTVGYTNLSHFAAAFRKKYGVNPSVIKKLN